MLCKEVLLYWLILIIYLIKYCLHLVVFDLLFGFKVVLKQIL